MSFLRTYDRQRDMGVWAVMDPHVIGSQGSKYHHVVVISMERAYEFTPWLDALAHGWEWTSTCQPRYSGRFVIHFEDLDDALLFKLTWGGE